MLFYYFPQNPYQILLYLNGKPSWDTQGSFHLNYLLDNGQISLLPKMCGHRWHHGRNTGFWVLKKSIPQVTNHEKIIIPLCPIFLIGRNLNAAPSCFMLDYVKHRVLVNVFS